MLEARFGRQKCDQSFPDAMTVLVDYFAQEITDSLGVAERFSGRVKLEPYHFGWTPGSRYVERLDPVVSYAVLEKHVPVLSGAIV